MSGSTSFWKRHAALAPGEPVSLMKSGNVKERKGILKRALKDSGYNSLNHACLVAGVSPSVIGRLLNGLEPLIGKQGGVNRGAVRLAEVLGETPERLFGVDMTWPDTLDIVIVRKPYDDRRHLLHQLIATLPQQYQTVLRLRFEEQLTLDETALKCGISRERARQREQKAIRMLRHPCRRTLLQECTDGTPDKLPYRPSFCTPPEEW